jgi:5'-nucleotidase/UDP-sugar diphosphatase
MKQPDGEKAMVYIAVSLLVFIVLSVFALVFSAMGIDWAPNYITILHTNDVHGRIEPFRYRDGKELVGGLAGRAALISSIESSNRNVITLDAGDFAQGTMFYNVFKGKPDVELMSIAGYDAGTLGNHEFDKGLNNLKNNLKAATYPFVAANIRFTKDAELQSLVKPYIIREQHGLKTAIIGLVPEDLKTLTNVPDGFEVLDPVETTRKIVKEVNPKVDMIIVLSHEGLEDDIKLAKSVPEIDVIVGGHSHTLLRHPMLFNQNGDKTLIVQDGEFGRYLGRLDLKMRDKKVQNYYYELIPINGNVPHNAMYEEINGYTSKYANAVRDYGKENVGKIGVTIGADADKTKTELTITGALVTNAIKSRFSQVDVVLQNSGGIRLRRSIGPGDLTLVDVTELYPFGNKVITLELKGSELKSILETGARTYPRPNDAFLQSLGLEYTINTAGKPQVLSDDGLKIISEGNRISDVKVDGIPLDNEKHYKIAVNDYIFNGGNGFSQFKKAFNVADTGVFIPDIIGDYVKNDSPLTVKLKDRINIK